ncbi:MAG: dicarboxylate/amino acid:cation symporter [Gemmatales bacterium]|nr:dicarboxylate/amino acid:cation symporter [Gemmatales bacterium]
MQGEPRQDNLPWIILLSLVLGAIAGIACNWGREAIDSAVAHVAGGPVAAVDWIVSNIARPLGQIFLNLLLMTVVPLVFASLASGVAQLGDWRRLGRVGLVTMALFVFSMALACATGLALVNWYQPGLAMPSEVGQQLLAEAKNPAPPARGLTVDTLVGIVPRNPFQAAVQMEMLQIIFFALMVGIALTFLTEVRRQTLLRLLEGVTEVMVVIIHLVMRIAPLAVFALIFAQTASFGWRYLETLGGYVLLALGGMAFHLVVSLGFLVWLLGGLAPWRFFPRIWTVMITAFSTSSSNATLPTTLRTAQQELGVPSQIAGFVIPLGATMNMNGTALYEGITALFLAQVYFGVTPDWTAQITVLVLAVLTAIGAAGVPGGSLPLLAMVLTSIGVPGEYIGIILGVDRLLDMARTVLNVGGDLVVAVCVARQERAWEASSASATTGSKDVSSHPA